MADVKGTGEDAAALPDIPEASPLPGGGGEEGNGAIGHSLLGDKEFQPRRSRLSEISDRVDELEEGGYVPPDGGTRGEEEAQEEGGADDGELDGRGLDDGEGMAEGGGGAQHGSTMTGGSIVSDVLYSIATGEEEGRSRQRILAFAAKRYQNAVERNPRDYDALYNWALVLQESADNCDPDAGPKPKDAMLDSACQKYAAATSLCPTLHEAFYNWAIAISDRAKIRGRTMEAEELWKQACEKYGRAVQLNWDSPQALNNWGLALQELSAIVPLREKRAIVRKAISKFRAAIRLRFDFHRAVYNLGTVLYGLAEDTLKAAKRDDGAEHPSDALYSQSAVYIAAAHALKSDYPVYRNALRLVRTMLPLPYLKGGYLLVPPGGNSLAPHAEWQSLWFVLDHDAFFQREKPASRQSTALMRSRSTAGQAPPIAPSEAERRSSTGRRPGGGGAPPLLPPDHGNGGPGDGRPLPSQPPLAAHGPPIRIDMSDVLSVNPCGDLSLPAGGGMVIETLTGSMYMVAENWDVLDGWVDALRLVYTAHVRRKTDALAAVLAG